MCRPHALQAAPLIIGDSKFVPHFCSVPSHTFKRCVVCTHRVLVLFLATLYSRADGSMNRRSPVSVPSVIFLYSFMSTPRCWLIILSLVQLSSYGSSFQVNSLEWCLYNTNNNKLCGRPAQYAPAQACKLTISSYLFSRWHLFRHVGYLRHQQPLTF